MMEGKQLRLLLADDHAVVRAGTRQFLETADDLLVIAEADDGLMAQSLISEHLPDIVVLDIRMPHLNGIDLTRWIRIHHPQVRILILTAYDDDPYLKAVLEAGADGYMLKTASPMAIVEAVRQICKGRVIVDPELMPKLVHAAVNRPILLPQQESLSERERQVLSLASKGDTNKMIAHQLGISSRTVQGHLANIYDKMHVSSRTEAVMKAVAQGWLTTNDSY